MAKGRGVLMFEDSRVLLRLDHHAAKASMT